MPETITVANRLQVEHEARDLLDEHGLYDWTVVFDNARRRSGQCNYLKKQISFSLYLMARHPIEDTRNTITHEVAHALTRGHGHDLTWKRQHIALGGNGKRCTSGLGDPEAPWVGTCGHGKRFERYRAPKQLMGWTCRCPRKSAVVWEKVR